MTRYRASAKITDDWEHFDFSVADGVATVTLNRPEKLNPLTFESYADLRDLLAELPHRGDTRVLVIRGEGKGFCGGGDVNEIIGELIQMDAAGLMRLHQDDRRGDPGDARVPDPDHRRHPGHRGGRRQRGRDRRRLPDLSRRRRGSRSCSPRSGCPAATWERRTSCRALVGYGRATELLMLGDTIDADTADRYGLVTQLLGDAGDLDAACETLARRLADGPTLGLQQTKSLITRELDMPIGPAMELDAMTQALLMTSDDHAEFHAAFNAKRKPDWKGR